MNALKSAGLAVVLRQPNTQLLCALRSLPIDDVWELFLTRAPRLPESAQSRFDALDLKALAAHTSRCDARIIAPGTEEWPVELDALGATAPWALWARGRALPTVAGVAIVGSRSCTNYGERTAADFAIGIGERGYPIVSGGAFGIDAAAHRGALATGAHTIAVLASGVDVPYPASHDALFERVVIDGTLLSESPPGTRPMRAAFLVRNRLIAALSQGTVVVEARFRSGALSTARHAVELNRVVMGVPGPIGSAESAGVHELIKHGAQLVTSAADVVSLISPIGSTQGELVLDTTTEWDLLSKHEQLIYETFPTKAPIRLHDIQAGMDVEMSTLALLATLTSLKQRGLIADLPDGSWRRVRTPGGAVA